MPNLNPLRGDIFWVKIPANHVVGREQFKRRPWLVVSSNSIHTIPDLDLVIGVPLSQKVHKQNRQYRILVTEQNVLLEQGSTLVSCDRVALTEQVRALSIQRLEFPRAARLTTTALYAVEAGVAFVLDIH